MDVGVKLRDLVFNRLYELDSMLECLCWLETVAMPAMPEAVTHQHLSRAMDAFINHVDCVESELENQIRSLVDHDLVVVFYDLTTVRIRGKGEVDDDIRAYGRNKATGGIALPFELGMVQTFDWGPLMNTAHPGNMAKMKTRQAMLMTVLQRFPI